MTNEKKPASRSGRIAELIYILAISAAIVFLPVRKIFSKQRDGRASEQAAGKRANDTTLVGTINK